MARAFAIGGTLAAGATSWHTPPAGKKWKKAGHGIGFWNSSGAKKGWLTPPNASSPAFQIVTSNEFENETYPVINSTWSFRRVNESSYGANFGFTVTEYDDNATEQPEEVITLSMAANATVTWQPSAGNGAFITFAGFTGSHSTRFRTSTTVADGSTSTGTIGEKRHKVRIPVDSTFYPQFTAGASATSTIMNVVQLSSADMPANSKNVSVIAASSYADIYPPSGKAWVLTYLSEMAETSYSNYNRWDVWDGTTTYFSGGNSFSEAVLYLELGAEARLKLYLSQPAEHRRAWAVVEV